MGSWRKSLVTHASATGDIWVNADQGLILWYEQSKWRMRSLSVGVGLGVVVDSNSLLKPCAWTYKDHQVFIGSTGLALYWTTVNYSLGGYVLAPTFLADLAEWTEDSIYFGTPWWVLSGHSPIGTYEARGSGHGGSTRTVGWEAFSGWSSTAFSADYSAEGSATGTKHVGWRWLTSSAWSGFNWRETPIRHNSRQTYALYNYTDPSYRLLSIWWDGSTWVASQVRGLKSFPYWLGGLSPAGTYNVVVDAGQTYTGWPSATIVVTDRTSSWPEAPETKQISSSPYYVGNVATCQ